MSQRNIKNVIASHQAAAVFLSICNGKRTLRSIAEHLSMKENTLQFYLKQLLDNNFIKREKTDKRRHKSQINPYLYYVNIKEFIYIHSKIHWVYKYTPLNRYLTPLAEKFLPVFSEHIFSAKKPFRNITLTELFEIFYSTVILYMQNHKKDKTKREQEILSMLMSAFIKMDAIFLDLNYDKLKETVPKIIAKR